MKVPYPQLSNVLGYRRIDADTVEVTNHLYDERFTLSLEQLRFLRELDGFTHPFRIPTPMSREEIKKLLRTAKEGGLTRRSTLWRSGWTVLKTLWEPAVGLGLCVTARIVNALLALAWLPVLIWGIAVFFGNLTELHGLGLELGLLGILPGILLHEIGHAFAGIAYGARVFEMGLLFQCWVLPVGAYVAMDDTRLGKWKRVQILAAGVEMNFLLTGLFLLLGAAVSRFNGAFLAAAVTNAFLGVTNLSFLQGLDGAGILSLLLGEPRLFEKAKELLRPSRRRRGQPAATLAACFVLRIMQGTMPLFVAANILEVIAYFL